MSATAQRLSLEEFYAYMDAHEGRPDIGEMRGRLDALAISMEDVAGVARFSTTGYQRNLLREGPGWHALVLCWRSGQRSPIHDHAKSVCGVKVLRGVATETVFEPTACGQLKAVSSRDLVEGLVCASQDSDVHQVSNLQAASEDLVTLHVYAPPLHDMLRYSIDDATPRLFHDPIVGHIDGSGI